MLYEHFKNKSIFLILYIYIYIYIFLKKLDFSLFYVTLRSKRKKQIVIINQRSTSKLESKTTSSFFGHQTENIVLLKPKRSSNLLQGMTHEF